MLKVKQYLNSIEIFNVSCNGLSKVTNPDNKDIVTPVVWRIIKLTAPKTAWFVGPNLVF